MPAKKRRVTRVQKHTVKRKRNLISFLSRGKISLSIILILGLITFGALYVIGGAWPAEIVNKPLSDTPYELDWSNVTTGGNPASDDDQLKLGTVPFKECANTLAVNFLVDVSGSMDFVLGSGKKIDKTIEALKSFKNKLPDNAVIGIQKFSWGIDPGRLGNGATPVVELSLLKDVKDTLDQRIDSLKPPSGSTWTREGFELAQQKLNNAIDANRFPGYNYSLIFISDGIPEYTADRDAIPHNCLKKVDDRCFSRTMDPRNPPGPDIPQQLKDKGVKIFSILIFSRNDDGAFESEFDKLMSDVASDPDSTYYVKEDVDAGRLEQILGTVSTRVCGS